MFAALLIASSAAPHAGSDFVLLLSQGRWAEATARFDARMSSGLDDGKLAALWASVIAKTGEFQKIERVDVDQVEGYRRETVICAFAKAKAGLRVVFDGNDRIAGFFLVDESWSPPPYVDSARFTERPVEVGPKHVRGALTIPKEPRFPIVVMLTGSGPNDMDESLGAIKVFKDLAQGLATLGVGSLRFEKRTHRKIPVRTLREEYLEDANAAIDQAARVPGASKVVLLGHSLGATLAPRVAVGSSTVAAVIMLAGSTWPWAKAIVEQLEYQKRLGFGGPEMEKLLADARAEAKLISDPALKPDTPVAHGATGAYYLDFRSYDQVSTAAWLEIPIWMGWGDRDLKVIPEDFAGWKAKLGDRPNVTIRVYPGLQHMFTPVGRPEVGHVAKEVITDLAAWIPR
jgi:dienelactone hydrolase